MTELLSCPFCGGEASLKTRSLDERFGYAEKSDAACKKCGIGYSFQDAQNPNGGYALGGTGALSAIAAWNTRAPTPAPNAWAVKVKPLVWVELSITKEHKGLSGVWLHAWGVNGQYEVHVFDTDPTHVMLNGPDIVPTEIYTTIEAAKAAAQADYDARIIAAIEIAPDPRDAVIARLVEAAEVAASDWAAHLEDGDPVPKWLDPIRAALAAAKDVMG